MCLPYIVVICYGVVCKPAHSNAHKVTFESFWNSIICAGGAQPVGTDRAPPVLTEAGVNDSNNPVQRELLKQRCKQMFGIHLCSNDLGPCD